MNKAKLYLFAFVGVVVLGAIIWGVSHWVPKDDPFAKDKAQSEQLDTAHVEREDSSAKVDTAIAKIEYTRVVALKAGKNAMVAANKTHAEADTLGQHAQTVRDSLNMWRSRDSAHVVENDSLRKKIHEDSTVIRSDSLQKLLYKSDRVAWVLHSDSLVRSMDTLRGDLKKAQEDQCRILPFVPCLSRKQSLIVGAVTGAVVAARPTETVNVIKKIFTLGR